MKILQKINFILILTLCSSLMCKISAQSLERRLISSAGNQSNINNVQFEWSFGEVFVSTLKSDDYIISQGLHQGNTLVSYIHSETEWSDLIIIYPNPAHNHLKLFKETDTSFYYQIINPIGQVVLKGKWRTRSDFINILSLDEGIYHLVIRDNNNNSQSYKFIKQ